MQLSQTGIFEGLSPRRAAVYLVIILLAGLLGVYLAQSFEALEKVALPVAVAGIIFGITYIGILSEKVHRTIAATAGAMCMVLAGWYLGFFSQQDAVLAIDWHTLGLLVAMMILTSILQRTGFFEYLAIVTAKKTKGDPWRLTFLLGSLIALISTMVANVITIVMIGPVTVAICEMLGINPIPLLISEALLSNVGGVATLVGDPPNMMIGSATGLSFNAFLIHMGPPVAVCVIVCLFTLKVALSKELSKKPENIEGLMKMDEKAAIHNPQVLRKVLVALGLVLVLFFFQDRLGLLPSSVAMLGMVVALLWVRPNVDEILKDVDWSVLLFFISLFVCVGGIEHAGILQMVGEKIAGYAHGSLMFTTALLFWVSAIASAIVDNIPFTIAMIPVVQYLETQGVNAMPLWWALAMGVGFGGNGTIIGASPNIIAVSISEKTKYPITFAMWLKGGTAGMMTTCIVGLLIMLLFFKFYQ